MTPPRIDPNDPAAIAVIADRMENLHCAFGDMKKDINGRLETLEKKVDSLVGLKNQGKGALWALTKIGAVIAFAALVLDKIRSYING
jgi:hypothetical protein